MGNQSGMIIRRGLEWIPYHGALVPDAAPHLELDLGAQDVQFLLKESGAWFLRWSSHFDMDKETAYWHVIKDGPCSLEKLSKNTRNQVRKGLKSCTVGRLQLTDLTTSGYAVYRRAMESYNTDLEILTPREFQDQLAGLTQDDTYEFWGVHDLRGELIAYAQNKIQNDSCNYQVIKLDPSHLKLYSSYALIFQMNDHYLNERKMLYINDGARSIRHDTGVQDFLIQKFKFNYKGRTYNLSP